MKKEILIVNDEMVVGGVARVLNNMLKYLDYSKYNVTLLVLHKHGKMLEDVSDNVTVIGGSKFFEVCDQNLKELIKKFKIFLILKKLYLIFLMKTGLIFRKINKERKKILNKRYDVEIAYKEGFCTVFVSCGDSLKKINWVHVDYKVFNYSKNYMPLMKKALSKIDVHVAQSIDAAKSYQEVFGLDNEFVVINNLIDIETIKKLSKEPYEYETNSFNIISVGRLHPQKAYDRLIRVIKKLSLKYDNFKLYILGDGPQHDMLKDLIKELDVSCYVKLLGYDKNPYKYIKNADLFILASIYESAPTVVYEALTVNETPIVVCDVAGVKKQLENGHFGMIVKNDEQGIYEGLSLILNDPKILLKYGENMKEYTDNNIFSMQKIERIFD